MEREKRRFGFRSLAVAVLLIIAVFGNSTVLTQTQSQNSNRPPNNSTPGTATANTSRPAVYKVDRHQITLRPKDGIEYKYQMEKGASWRAGGSLSATPKSRYCSRTGTGKSSRRMRRPRLNC
jgi:hypothetical protein